MNTPLLKTILERLAGSKFCGGYAENTLPQRIKTYPCGFIANTDPKSQPGQHWVAFYFPSPDEGEFFDSYGYPPGFYSPHFTRLLNQNSERWSFNSKPLQSAETAVCGEYCIYYLIHRMRGVNMTTIVQQFSKNRISNDHKVYEFVLRLMRQ